MAVLVILVLAVLWGAVLLPPILRSRNGGGGAPSGVGDFLNRLRDGLGRGRGSDPSLPALTPLMGPMGPIGAAGPMPPGTPMGPMGSSGPLGPGAPMGPVRVPGAMTPTQRRRRDVLVGLLAAAGLTFLMALFAGSMVLWVMNLLADALLGGYVYLLLQYKARNAEARPAEARPPARRPAPAPAQGPPQNVAQLASRRNAPNDITAPSHVDAPREATVLALRRTASW